MKKLDLKSFILGKSGNIQEQADLKNTERLVPVKSIGGGVVELCDGRMITVIEVLPINFYLKSEIEQRNIISGFAAWLKIAPSKIQILVTSGQASVGAFCDRLEEFYYKESNESCKQMIYEDASLVNSIAETEAVSRSFYIILPYEGNSEKEQAIKELSDTAFTAMQYLEGCGLEAVRQRDTDLFLLSLFYRILRSETAEAAELKEFPEKERIKDILIPDTAGLTNKDSIEIENTYHSHFYLSGGGYPTVVGLAWLSPLIESVRGIKVSFILERKPKEQILKKIGDVTMLNRSRIKDVGDTRSDYEELDDAIESGMYMKNQINREGEDFYYMHTLLSVSADTEDELKRLNRELVNFCGSLNFNIRRASYIQDKAFTSMLPALCLDKDIGNKARRNVLTSGAAAAFPFSSFEMCDETGIFYGLNLHNSTAVIMNHYDTSRYSNGNMAVFGMSGAGKTFFLMLTAMRLRMQGVQVYMITPEKGFEYRNACNAVGGRFIQIGAGSNCCINLMEIRRTTLDIDADIKQENRDDHSVLLDKIQNLHIFFALLYPDITPDEKYLLDRAILDCYKSFGITRDNRSLTGKDGKIKEMPCFKELIPFMEKYGELKSITLALKRVVEGSAAGLGGQTNIDLNAEFIVLDTSRLSKEFTALGTFIATEFVKDRISLSRINKKAVILDEAWKIAGESGNEQASEFVISLVKTVRGYGAIFISATQNVIDYFALNDGKFGDALLGNSRLKLLLQLEETEAVKLKDKLMLTDSEMMQVIRSGRGEGLLCAGKNRIAIQIRASQTEYDLITTDRASLEKRIKK